MLSIYSRSVTETYPLNSPRFTTLVHLYDEEGNVNAEAKFMNRNAGKIILDAIISDEQLRKGEDFVSICEKGMKQMLNFNYGELDLNKLSKSV